jgi:hypothetical protein
VNFALYNIQRLVFVTEIASVYCAVRLLSLDLKDNVSFLKGLINRYLKLCIAVGRTDKVQSDGSGCRNIMWRRMGIVIHARWCLGLAFLFLVCFYSGDALLECSAWHPIYWLRMSVSLSRMRMTASFVSACSHVLAQYLICHEDQFPVLPFWLSFSTHCLVFLPSFDALIYQQQH